MKYECVVNWVDRFVLEVKRKGDTVLLVYKGCYILVINPDVMVDQCPLITFVAVGNHERFDNVLGEICRNDLCESFFTSKPEKHLMNGFGVRNEPAECEIVTGYANEALSVYLEYRKKYENVGRVPMLSELIDADEFTKSSTDDEGYKMLTRMQKMLQRVCVCHLEDKPLTSKQFAGFQTIIGSMGPNKYYMSLFGIYGLVDPTNKEHNRPITKQEWRMLSLLADAAIMEGNADGH